MNNILETANCLSGDCPEKEVTSMNVAVDSCMKELGILSNDDYSIALKKIACKVVSLKTEISSLRSLNEVLSGSINTFKELCCNSLKSVSISCLNGQSIKVSTLKKSIDGGLTYTINPLQGSLLSSTLLSSLGFTTFINGSSAFVYWNDTPAIKWIVVLACDGTQIPDSQLNIFTVPTCTSGYLVKVTTFKINGVDQLFSGDWDQAFQDQLSNYGFTHSGNTWIINSVDQYEIGLSCIAMDSSQQNFSVNCEMGCQYKIQVGGLKRNNININSTALVYNNLADMLLYLKSIDGLWSLTGNTFSINSIDIWNLVVECFNCNVPGSTCEIHATYSGGIGGQSIDVYYTLNGGPVQLVNLLSGQQLNVPSSSVVDIVSVNPQGGGSYNDWNLSYVSCNIVPDTAPVFDETVAFSGEGAGGNGCIGNIRGEVDITGLAINSTNDGLLPGNSISVTVDGVPQALGIHYGLSFSGGVVKLSCLAPYAGLGGNELPTVNPANCNNGYAQWNAHAVNIIANNGTGEMSTFNRVIIF